MIGFPSVIATKDDYLNLLSDPEFHDQALADLTALQDFNDLKVTRSIILEDGTESTDEIDNPNPLWKQKGFESWQDVADTVEEYQ